MKDYLDDINEKHPIRRNDGEKNAFFDYLKAELGEWRVRQECLDKNNNIIIDDISSAKVIFTAHYDTPARSFIPNLMMPQNKLISNIYHIGCPLLLAFACIALAFGISSLIGQDYTVAVIIYLILYYTLFFLLSRCGSNKHNKNDNTSGIATLMSIASEYQGKEVAFVMFDNEEKGILGSKAFAEKYKELLADKLIVNFDCVGNGDQFVCIVKEAIEQSEPFEKLKAALDNSGDFSVHYLPFKKSASNSDHKRFERSVGIMACRKGRMVKFITDRIHTSKDTVADIKNVIFLADRMIDFIKSI